MALLLVRAFVVFVSGASSVACATPVIAQRAASHKFLLLARGDTAALERYTRSGDTLTGELILPRANRRAMYRLVTHPDKTVSSVTLSANAATSPWNGKPTQQAIFMFSGDSIQVQPMVPPGPARTMKARRDALIWINPSVAFLEQLVLRYRAIGGARVEIPLLNVNAGTSLTVVVTSVGSDSVIVTFPDVQLRVRVDGDGNVLGGVVPTQGARLVRVENIAERKFAPRVDYAAPAGAPYTAEDVTVAVPAGYTLAGTLVRPRGSPRRTRSPVAVLITGSGLQDRDEALPGVQGYRPFRDIADTLARRGVAVLRLDDRGYGASTGNPANATTQDFANDIRAAITYLRTRPDIDANRMALIGHSEGGLIAPMIAATDSGIRAIILMAASAYPGRRVLEEQQRWSVLQLPNVTVAQRDSLLDVARRATDSMARVQPWLRNFLTYDPLPTARQVRRAGVLVLQGATDRQVTDEQATLLGQAFRAGGNSDVTVRVFPETNHLFLADPSGDPRGYARVPSKRVRVEVLGTIADWLSTRLRRD